MAREPFDDALDRAIAAAQAEAEGSQAVVREPGTSMPRQTARQAASSSLSELKPTDPYKVILTGIFAGQEDLAERILKELKVLVEQAVGDAIGRLSQDLEQLPVTPAAEPESKSLLVTEIEWAISDYEENDPNWKTRTTADRASIIDGALALRNVAWSPETTLAIHDALGMAGVSSSPAAPVVQGGPNPAVVALARDLVIATARVARQANRDETSDEVCTLARNALSSAGFSSDILGDDFNGAVAEAYQD